MELGGDPDRLHLAGLAWECWFAHRQPSRRGKVKWYPLLMFRIGGFAGLSGVSAKTLRAYDELGLFRPAWVDPGSAYRYYSAAQLPELRRILALRDLGLGLEQIGRLVSGRADLEAALRRRRLELEREQTEAARRLAALDISVARASSGGPRLDVVLRRLAEEPVAMLDLSVNPGQDIAAAFDRLELHVRRLDRRAHRPPGAIVGDTAGPGRPSDLIFVPLTRPSPPTLSDPEILYRTLPAGRAATVLVRGPYGHLAAAAHSLRAWVEASGRAVAGDLRILYLQFGADVRLGLPDAFVVEGSADFLTELQLPID
jgi:DNA-binding transcriptional MerR regulator